MAKSSAKTAKRKLKVQGSSMRQDKTDTGLDSDPLIPSFTPIFILRRLTIPKYHKIDVGPTLARNVRIAVPLAFKETFGNKGQQWSTVRC